MKQILVAIKIVRRGCAMAVFVDYELDHVEHRALSAELITAQSALATSLAWIFATFPTASAALELPSPKVDDTRRQLLTEHALSVLRAQAVSLREIDSGDVFRAFSEPPPRTRRGLRSICSVFWPQLANRRFNPAVLDAAALGLYVQVEQILS